MTFLVNLQHMFGSRYLALWFLLLTPLFMRGQGAVRLSGKVTDVSTGKPLPFAQLSVQHKTFGTVTNEDGRFELKIPADCSGDTLLVAYMGYDVLKQPISAAIGDTVALRLIPRPLQLAEVEIVALTPEEVIRQVVAHIPSNYGEDSLILTAFIRSQKFVGGRLAEYAEAIIMDLKTGYRLYPKNELKQKQQESNVSQLQKGRVLSDTNMLNAIGDLGRSAGCLGCNFIHDFVEFYHQTVLDEKLFRHYNFKMEELTSPDAGKIYHIWFDQKKGVKETLWRGEVFVNAADFALLKITQKPSFEAFGQYEKQKFRRSFTIRNTSGWIEEMPLMEWTTTYISKNGKYSLETIRIANWMTFTHSPTGQKLRFSFKNEVVVTDVTRDPLLIRNFKGDKSVGVNQRWDQVVGTSDASFWAEFNYLPIEEKLKKEIDQIAK